MPTAAKLFAAICLAIVALVASLEVMKAMPPTTAFGYFLPLNVVLGLVVGWMWLGPNVGDGPSNGISYGLTSAAVLTFVALFLQAFNEMLRLAMRNRFDGPFEAFAAIFVQGLSFAQYLNLPIILVLVVGGALAGVVADWAGRRWS